jgi:hypothetical protein
MLLSRAFCLRNYGDNMIGFNTHQITKVEGIELLKSQGVNKENLLVKLDGTTLRITKGSWFSIKPSPKKIFDDVMKLSQVDYDKVSDHVKNAMAEALEKLLDAQVDSITPAKMSSEQLKNEPFITKIIRCISEYFGWRLSQKDIAPLLEAKNTLDGHLANFIPKAEKLNPPIVLSSSNDEALNNIKRYYNGSRGILAIKEYEVNPKGEAIFTLSSKAELTMFIEANRSLNTALGVKNLLAGDSRFKIMRESESSIQYKLTFTKADTDLLIQHGE